ncbi:MAG: hypothetical protein AAFZ65_21110, partial [Planctomycetota bacterium]
MRAPVLLILGLIAASGGVLWLLGGSGPSSPDERARLDPPAARPVVQPTLELPRSPAPLSTAAVPTDSRVGAAPLESAPVAVPRTAQSALARVVLPRAGGLNPLDAQARLIRGAEVVAGPIRPDADGSVVLELDAAVSGVSLVVTHPGCAPATLGPFAVGAGERRSLGLVRPRPAARLELRVESESGAPASDVFAWILPPPGLQAGPLPAVAADGGGRFELAVPVGARGVLVRGNGSAQVLEDATESTVRLAADGDPWTGQVIDRRDGTPLVGARAEVLFDRSSLFSTACDADGRFDLGRGLDSRFELRLSCAGFATRVVASAFDRTRPIALEPLEGRRDSTRASQSPRTLQVLDAGRAPLAAGLQLFARAPSDAEVWLGRQVDVSTDAEGRVALDLDAAGLHTAVVRAPGHEPQRVAAGELRRRTTVTPL